jgi:hypothetical protein
MRALPTLLSLLAALPAMAAEPVASDPGRPVRAVAESEPPRSRERDLRSAHRDHEQGAVILEMVVDPVTGRAITRRHHCTGHRFPAASKPAGPRK